VPVDCFAAPRQDASHAAWITTTMTIMTITTAITIT
jgi:hypothetical protein